MLSIFLGINDGITKGNWIAFFVVLIIIVAIAVLGLYYIGQNAWKEFQEMRKIFKKDRKGTTNPPKSGIVEDKMIN